jgi:hypothetical protein
MARVPERERCASPGAVGVLCLAGAAVAARTGLAVRRGEAAERTESVRTASAILLVLAAVSYFVALPFVGATGQ